MKTARYAALVGFHRHGERREVAIYPTVGKLTIFIPAPTALTRHAEARMSQQHHQPSIFAQFLAGRPQHCLKRLHILDAQQENDSIVAMCANFLDLSQSERITEDELPVLAVTCAGQFDQLWAD